MPVDMLLRLWLLLHTLFILRLLDCIKVMQYQGGNLRVSLPVLIQQALNFSSLSFCRFHNSLLNWR